MAITVYTYNDKVLKNVATDKWLKKKEAPAGFVMNASNIAYINGGLAYWESPGYADDYYDGNGKTIIITLTEDLTALQAVELMYCATSSEPNGPDILGASQFPITVGTYTFTMLANPVPPGVGYTMGKYIMIDLKDSQHAEQDLSKITITIVDP